MLEGGEYFLLIKSLITGSVRKQSLEETLKYFEEKVLYCGECYFKETIELLNISRESSIKMVRNIWNNI